jgi:hypothetical protein
MLPTCAYYYLLHIHLLPACTYKGLHLYSHTHVRPTSCLSCQLSSSGVQVALSPAHRAVRRPTHEPNDVLDEFEELAAAAEAKELLAEKLSDMW